MDMRARVPENGILYLTVSSCGGFYCCCLFVFCLTNDRKLLSIFVEAIAGRANKTPKCQTRWRPFIFVGPFLGGRRFLSPGSTFVPSPYSIEWCRSHCFPVRLFDLDHVTSSLEFDLCILSQREVFKTNLSD